MIASPLFSQHGMQGHHAPVWVITLFVGVGGVATSASGLPAGPPGGLPFCDAIANVHYPSGWDCTFWCPPEAIVVLHVTSPEVAFRGEAWCSGVLVVSCYGDASTAACDGVGQNRIGLGTQGVCHVEAPQASHSENTVATCTATVLGVPGPGLTSHTYYGGSECVNALWAAWDSPYVCTLPLEEGGCITNAGYVCLLPSWIGVDRYGYAWLALEDAAFGYGVPFIVCQDVNWDSVCGDTYHYENAYVREYFRPACGWAQLESTEFGPGGWYPGLPTYVFPLLPASAALYNPCGTAASATFGKVYHS